MAIFEILLKIVIMPLDSASPSFLKLIDQSFNLYLLQEVHVHVFRITSRPAFAGMADRTAHSRRSVQKLWRIHLVMLIYMLRRCAQLRSVELVNM